MGSATNYATPKYNQTCHSFRQFHTRQGVLIYTLYLANRHSSHTEQHQQNHMQVNYIVFHRQSNNAKHFRSSSLKILYLHTTTQRRHTNIRHGTVLTCRRLYHSCTSPLLSTNSHHLKPIISTFIYWWILQLHMLPSLEYRNHTQLNNRLLIRFTIRKSTTISHLINDN